MKRGLLFCYLSIICSVALNAADGRYAVSGISPLLKINADAVIRLEETGFTIKGLKETIQTNHYVITVLNENGDKWAEFSEYYDNLRSIVSAEGYLYDPDGQLIRKVKKKDMQDFGTNSGSFIDDNRVKVHSFHHRSYPYTVEYNVEISNRSSLFFPMWSPRPGGGISVEKSTMKVICPADYKFRYKAFLYNSEPEVAVQKNTRITTWSVKDQPAIRKEPLAPRWHEMATTILLGPGDFQVGEYKGNMDTWENFAAFIQSLKKGRDQLPENIRAEVHQIADGLLDQKEKIKALYEYMQRNTHYVNISLGIGGWQPFDAKYVAANRYGDCKALTNYMYSLLKEIGIDSYYTLIRAGKNERYLTTEFPSQQFNHVILCVPLPQDTVWLECTSQSLPAGYLSSFTSNRTGLLVGDGGSGGKLIRTPFYGIHENRQVRVVKAALLTDGGLHVNAVTKYAGLLQDETHSLINNLSPDKVKEYLQDQLDFATYEVGQFDYKEEKSSLPFINESLEINVDHYATTTGKRLFVSPDVMTRSALKLSADATRRYAIELGIACSYVDSVEINLPDGYTVESMPANMDLTTRFGTYKSIITIKDNKIFYYRKMEQFGGRFPAEDYEAVVKFYDEVYRSDRSRLVLIRK
ncbi:MAG: hypothetical protein DI535_12505 [Citrobacter freundii]|nr:MAG: hypothetical protein DI535_12505 [Citrobacter freundii]